MTDQTIALDTLAQLLATERRQLVIRALEDKDPIRLTELADELHSDSPHWSSRKDTYTTLQRDHVPKLVEEGIVAYRDDERKITQGPRFEIALEGLDALAGVVDDGDQRIVPDGGREWIPCDLCGAEYRSQAAALRCCDDRFEDDLDPDDRPAMSAVDEHGAPSVITDGGRPFGPEDLIATNDWSRRVTTEGGINELVTDLEVGIHNMWVDIRSLNDFGEYDPVTIEITATVTGGEMDD